MTCRDVCPPCIDGARCDRCGDRLCELNGPEPRVCGTTCRDCPCACTGCADAARDAADERAFQAERDAL